MKVPGDVTIIVEPQPAPRKSFPDAPPVEASDGFLATIRNYLEPGRIVTTNLHVVGPKYHAIRIGSLVFLKKRTSEAEIRPAVERALLDFFDAVSGGPEKLGWDFGRPVFTSEVSQRIARVPGVDYVTEVRINDRKISESAPLAYDELPKYVPGNIRFVPFEQRSMFAGQPAASDEPAKVETQRCKGTNCG